MIYIYIYIYTIKTLQYIFKHYIVKFAKSNNHFLITRLFKTRLDIADITDYYS